MKNNTYTLLGSQLSYYTGKTRSYLLHKRIPFVERNASAWDWLVAIPRKVGASVVPVLITPEGQWLQDSSAIIDELEQRFPELPAAPSTPVLRFVSCLFELWGDEFLLPLAMHTRWNRPEHAPWFIEQAGADMLPGWPRILQRMAGGRVAATMSGFVDVLGFGRDMAPVLENFGRVQLDGLNEHFSRHRFLLGDRPSLGDYGLIGPLFAHLGRDPLAKRDWIDTRPHLRDWIIRMFDPESSAGGLFFAKDEVPETLLPALRSIFDEMLPFISACADEVARLPVLRAGADKPPRVLGVISYPMAGGRHTRRALSYPVWMAQRMLEVYAAMTPVAQQKVRAWLVGVGGEALLDLKLPRMQRVGLAAARIG